MKKVTIRNDVMTRVKVDKDVINVSMSKKGIRYTIRKGNKKRILTETWEELIKQFKRRWPELGELSK